VEEVMGLLKQYDPSLAQSFYTLYQGFDDVVDANRFWRRQLSLLTTFDGVDTSSQRRMLYDGISLDMWLDNFQKYTLAFVVQHKLPRFSYESL
jgi:hypothetical protein